MSGPPGTPLLNRAVGVLALAAFTAFALIGVARVPFHPDEASLLYQSRDLEQLLRDPTALVWTPGTELDDEATYRALNPPLPKYLLGLGRRLAGYTDDAVSVDWDWSADWATNQQRGALPPQRLLTGARTASTLLLPTALLLTFWIGQQLGGRAVGGLSAVLLGFNALFLLHGRRAMMEGALFLGLCLMLGTMLRADRRPWLAGLSLGLALTAKHSLAALLPLTVLATLWSTDPGKAWRERLFGLAKLLLAALAVVLVFNPFLWANPLAGAARIWQARISLASTQLQTLDLAEQVAVELPMSASDRLAAFLGQVYFAPPQFQEATNYQSELSGQAAEYLRLPAHNWLRGWIVGGALFGLTLTGAAAAAVSLPRRQPGSRRTVALLLLSTALMSLAMLVAVPFPFQRYYVPMLPFVALWSAFAAIELGQIGKRLLSRRAAAG